MYQSVLKTGEEESSFSDKPIWTCENCNEEEEDDDDEICEYCYNNSIDTTLEKPTVSTANLIEKSNYEVKKNERMEMKKQTSVHWAELNVHKLESDVR